MNDKEELYNCIELLRTELNKKIDMVNMDLTQEEVVNKNRELDGLLLEYQKKYMDK